MAQQQTRVVVTRAVKVNLKLYDYMTLHYVYKNTICETKFAKNGHAGEIRNFSTFIGKFRLLSRWYSNISSLIPSRNCLQPTQILQDEIVTIPSQCFQEIRSKIRFAHQNLFCTDNPFYTEFTLEITFTIRNWLYGMYFGIFAAHIGNL